MNPATFEYHKAGSVDEAIALLREHEADAKLLAGGHSLLPIMKLRLAQPAHLIDIGALAELRGIQDDGSTVRIGALTTHHALELDETLHRLCPLLPEAAHVVGDGQVRNRGTIGGTLAHADPAADYPAVILALDAQLIARGAEGERTIAATEFFVGFLTTALAPDEVLTEIRIPHPAPKTGMSYHKLANQASGYATVGVAAVITLGADGGCEAARIGVTGATSSAVRASATEEALRGQQLDESTVGRACDLIGDGLEFLDDIHAPADYRRHVTRGLARRAVMTAAGRVRGT